MSLPFTKPRILVGPDENFILSLRFSPRQTARYSLLMLLMRRNFPAMDAEGDQIFSEDKCPVVTDKFKIKLIRRYEGRLVKAVRSVQDALRNRNRGKARLMSLHQNYFQNMKAKDISSLIRYTQMNYTHEQNSLGVNSIEFGRIHVEQASSSTLLSWKKKGLWFHHESETGIRTFRNITNIIKRAPVFPGEFVLWRNETELALDAVQPGQKLPFPSIIATSLMVPSALGLGESSGCLLKIRVRFDEVPAISTDYVNNLWMLRNMFQVLLHPCFLSVENCETVQLSRLMNAAEKRILPAFVTVQPPTSVRVVTCRAQPGRLVFAARRVVLVPRGRKTSRAFQKQQQQKPAPNTEKKNASSIKIVTEPDENLLLTVRLPGGKKMVSTLPMLLRSKCFPYFDGTGKQVLPMNTVIKIPDSFRLHLIHRYETILIQLVRELKTALKVHNPNIVRLTASHKKYLENMKTKNVIPVVIYIMGAFMLGQYRNNTFKVELEDFNKVPIEGVRHSTLAKWEKKKLFFYNFHERGVQVFRKLESVITRAPTIRGEFVLWRKQDSAYLSHVKPGQILPCPSFVSTSLLLPFAMNWTQEACCLLKIHVRFDEVPGLAVMDHLSMVNQFENQYEVVLHPCYLRVEECKSVTPSQLITATEKRVLPLISLKGVCEFPPKMKVITCRAQPGRLVYGQRSIALRPC